MGRIGNIINKKGKQDAKRAKIFTKHARAIAVAAKEGGGNPDYNAALKTAIEKAKADNMPNDNIDRAIAKGAGAGANENYETIVYEGYGPGGVAVIVETLTDNKNRTAGNVRYYFDKNGGNLGTSGCVSFMFDNKGQILIEASDDVSEDELMEAALEAGAEDFITEEDGYEVELTYNYDQEKPYDLGNGFSHIAVGVEDIEAERERHISLGYEVTPMKGLSDGAATYYFVTDPDGYKVEVIKL